jgi:hypothetical protein
VLKSWKETKDSLIETIADYEEQLVRLKEDLKIADSEINRLSSLP